ncbi:MAG TPA: ribonuclease D [Thiolinea sp.]|nr:ribonuclease D [Thiolinea sp.]
MSQYIDTSTKLTQYLQAIDQTGWVALDTEFMREKTYFPRLCLIQIATADTLACIDPLCIDDLQPLFSWLQQPHITKVFHAAGQDMEIFHYLAHQIPTPVFDTQIAAAVLGLGDQMGYARLVEQLLKVQLDKSQSRTDWQQRPLRQRQLDYAIDDVRYLRQIYPLLRAELEQSGRMGWLDKSFRKLTDPATYQPVPYSSWERIRNLQLLKPAQLAILRELAAWREEQAMHKDRPRRWILGDEVLVDMSRMHIEKADDLHQIRGLSEEQIQRHAGTWLELIRQARALPREQWPQLPRKRKLDSQLSLVADLLMVAVSQQAGQHNISPQMLASRAQVEKMLTEGRQKLSDDWRGNLLNDIFADLLAGHSSLQIRNQQVILEPSAPD